MARKQTPAKGLPVCGRCGLLIYPPASAGRLYGTGCTCSRPQPTPGLYPGGADAEQFALFTPAALAARRRKR